jgi:TonB family protein
MSRQFDRQFGIGGLIASAGLAALALVGAAGAEPQSRKSDRDRPPDPGKPAFFVDWAASNSPPGLTARPSRAKSDSLPVYPAESVRKGEAGTTALTMCVTADGRLVDIKLARSSGFARLDEATIEWERGARFNPALINGDPVNVCGYSLEYAWKLGG